MPDFQAERAARLYDRLAPVYGPLAGWWERSARQAGLDLLAASPGQRILELGCGPGAALLSLARSVGHSGQVVGVDVSPQMCAVARRRVERAPAPVEVLEADATDLPLPDGGFEACFMSFTLELFEPEAMAAVLSECRRVLQPAGRLAVVGLSAEGPDTVMRRVYSRAHRRFPQVVDCRPIRVEHTLRNAGFEVLAARAVRLWGLPVEIVGGQVPRAIRRSSDTP